MILAKITDNDYFPPSHNLNSRKLCANLVRSSFMNRPHIIMNILCGDLVVVALSRSPPLARALLPCWFCCSGFLLWNSCNSTCENFRWFSNDTLKKKKVSVTCGCRCVCVCWIWHRKNERFSRRTLLSVIWNGRTNIRILETAARDARSDTKTKWHDE